MSAMIKAKNPNHLAPMDGSWGVGTKAVNLCEEDFERKNRIVRCLSCVEVVFCRLDRNLIKDKKMHDAIFYPRVNNIPGVASATRQATWDTDPRSGSYSKEANRQAALVCRLPKRKRCQSHGQWPGTLAFLRPRVGVTLAQCSR